MRFNDSKYVNDYRELGTFPAIHNDIFNLINNTIEDKNIVAIDLGSCTGLLTLRLARKFKYVVGIEANQQDYLTANTMSLHNTDFEHAKVNPFFMETFLKDVQAKLIVARRVFPEISNGQPEVIEALSGIFFDAGVKYIAIEGRVDSVNATHPLKNLKKEIELFNKHYKILVRYRNCAILQCITFATN